MQNDIINGNEPEECYQQLFSGSIFMLNCLMSESVKLHSNGWN